ncbi:hypothetical protein QR98_0078140 [Sarcoptes scabiei]|uniref:Uncharacterized protein n=1 Tax=Sarcoptes scabiei TaxID=52283 RepID=A0A132AFR8_SARSC|nr:hypothetical protein QR98_0078140 [Sarcoptes scabiei]
MDESVNNTVTEDANLMLTFVAPVSQPPSSMIAIDENQNTENVVVMVNNDVDQIINETTAVTELNEQLTFTGECYERDGQLFMIFQNEKGEKIHVCSASATIKTDNEIVQSIDTVETDYLKTNLESNLVSAPMQIVINQNDNTVTVAENTAKIIEPSIEEPFMESSLPLQSEQNQNEIIPLDQSIAIEKASIETKISLEDNTDQKYSTDEIREKVTTEDSSEPLQNVEERNHSKDGEEPPQSEKNSTSDQTDLASSTLKTSSNSIPSSSTSLRSSISINKELKPISPSSQLAKSPQTYSKISNIVWVSLPEKKSSERKQLTTTIEIADPNMAPEPKSNKINVINDKVNFLPKVIPKSVSSDFKVTLTNKPSTSDGLMSISLKEKAVPNIKSEEKSMTKPIIMSNKIILSPKPIEIKKVSEPPKKNDYTNIKGKIQVDDDFSIEKNKSIDKSIPSERQLRGRNSLSSNSSISETNEINTNLTKSSAIEKKTDNKILKRVSFSEPCNPPIKARSPPSSIKKISERQTYSRTKIVPEIKPTTQSLSSSTAEIDFKKQEFRRESDYCDFKINDLRVSIRIQPEFREGQFSNKSLYRENRDYQAKCLQQPEIENFKSTKIMMNKNEDRMLTELEQIETNDNSTDRKRINTRKRKSTNGSDDYVGELNNRNYESSDKDLNLESFDSDDSLAEDKSDLDEAKKISLNGFTIHDVVWIATKIGHWPALITEISMNDKRLFLRLIDCPIKKERFHHSKFICFILILFVSHFH